MPLELHLNNLKLNKGDDPVFTRSGNMVSCAWHDTKRVHFLSTIHTDNTTEKQIHAKGHEGGHRTVSKSVMAEVYNSHMGGVDLLNQKMSTFGYPHKVTKWYHCLYHQACEVVLVNGYILYVKSQSSDANVLSPRAFRMKVIDGLLEGYQKRERKKGHPSVQTDSARLSERHLPGMYEDAKYKPDCKVCSNIPGVSRRKQKRYKCLPCNKPMCVTPCFELYHTHKDYKRAAATLLQAD